MIVRFVDIDGIGDHQCLNFIFIIIMNNVRLNNNVITLNSHFCMIYSRSPPVFGGIRVTQSLVLCVCFVDRCFSFCTFSFGLCVVFSSLIYGFLLPL